MNRFFLPYHSPLLQVNKAYHPVHASYQMSGNVSVSAPKGV